MKVTSVERTISLEAALEILFNYTNPPMLKPLLQTRLTFGADTIATFAEIVDRDKFVKKVDVVFPSTCGIAI